MPSIDIFVTTLYTPMEITVHYKYRSINKLSSTLLWGSLGLWIVNGVWSSIKIPFIHRYLMHPQTVPAKDRHLHQHRTQPCVQTMRKETWTVMMMIINKIFLKIYLLHECLWRRQLSPTKKVARSDVNEEEQQLFYNLKDVCLCHDFEDDNWAFIHFVLFAVIPFIFFFFNNYSYDSFLYTQQAFLQYFPSTYNL